MARLIIPAILTDKFAELEKQIKQVDGLFPYAQLDIMDGQFVPNRSVEEIDKIENLPTALPFELHLMVNDPAAEMRRWREVDNVFRVLFHAEAPGDTLRSLSFARKEGWEIGMAINPDTPLSTVKKYFDKIDVLQFMTVYPGRQGAQFQEQVLPKIEEFTRMKLRPLCAVDGGINDKTIKLFKNLSVEIFNVGGFLMKAENIELAHQQLQKILN